MVLRLEFEEQVTEDVARLIERLPETSADVRRHPARHRPGVIWLLLDRAERLREEGEFDAAVDMSRFGVAMAKQMRKIRWICESDRLRLMAQGYLVLGGTLRTLGPKRFLEAEVCYTMAFESLFAGGAQSPVHFVEYYCRAALFERDRRRFDLAEQLANRGVEIAHMDHDVFWIPRAQNLLGSILFFISPERAIPHYRAAHANLSPADGLYYQTTLQSLTASLCESDGSLEEIFRLWQEIRDRYSPREGTISYVYQQWTGALVAIRADEVEEAVELLLATTDGFAEMGILAYAAIAALDLACLYYDVGQFESAEKLAEDMALILRSEDLSEDFQAAALLRIRAAAKGVISRIDVPAEKRFLMRMA